MIPLLTTLLICHAPNIARPVVGDGPVLTCPAIGYCHRAEVGEVRMECLAPEKVREATPEGG